MAFNWFRRRQKTVMIIMVALMVSFLIGFAGFSTLFQKDPMKASLGDTIYGEVTQGERILAGEDLDLIQMLMSVDQQSMGGPRMELAAILANQRNDRQSPDVALSYAMLIKEAQGKDIKVSDADVNSFLTSINLSKEQYASAVDNIRRRYENRMTDARVNDAILRWVAVQRYFNMSFIATPPSQEQLRVEFASYAEKITVRQAMVTVEMFKDKLKLSDKDLEVKADELFKLYNANPPGAFSDANPFGFGYLQPQRIKIAYLFVNQDAVRRVVTVSDEQLAEYFRVNRAKYSKSTTAPANLSDVLEKVKADASAAALADMSGMVIASVRQEISAQPDDKSYKSVFAKFVSPANEAVSTPLGQVAIDNLPLTEAVKILAAKANLSAICYPTGKVGSAMVDPATAISVSGKDMTLGQALAEVSAQVRKKIKDGELPEMQWNFFSPVSNAIFPILQPKDGVASYEFFPIQAEVTAEVTPEDLAINPLLRGAKESGGSSALSDQAFGVAGQGSDGMSAITVGVDGPMMDVGGQNSGKLFWRVLDRKNAFVPTEISQLDPISKVKLFEDVKLQAEFAMANEYAARIHDADQLAAAIEADKLQVQDVGPFSRQDRTIGGIQFTDAASRAKFVEKAFSLAPESLTVFPATSSEVAMVPMASLGYVAILQRIGYVPPSEQDYNCDKGGAYYFTLTAADSGESVIKISQQSRYSREIDRSPAVFTVTVNVSGGNDASAEPKMISAAENGGRVSVAKGQKMVLRLEDALPMYSMLIPNVDGKAVTADPRATSFVPNKNSLVEMIKQQQQMEFYSMWFNGNSVALRVGFQAEKNER